MYIYIVPLSILLKPIRKYTAISSESKRSDTIEYS